MRGTAVAELIRTAWRLAPRDRNSVAARGYPSAAGTVMSSLNMSSSPGSATVFSSQLASGHSKSEIGFCRKGLSGLPEI